MEIIKINDRLGDAILVRNDDDGMCELSTLETQHDEAEVLDRGDVWGWTEFDGENRQWYRLPGAAWRFCFRTAA